MVVTSRQLAISEPRKSVGSTGFDKSEVEGSIPQRFSKQLALRGNAIAVREQDRFLTYRELDALSNQVAHRLLREAGTGPSRVALIFPLTLESIAGYLGIWKAGKTCVPIDPIVPAARTAEILRDAEATCAIASGGLPRSALKPSLADRIFEFHSCVHSMPDTCPAVSVDSNVPAALLYTSSDGRKPKGVVHTHRTLLHRCWSDTHYLQLASRDRISLFASPGLSGVVPQILSALLNGASLHPFDLQRREFEESYEWLWSQRISIFYPPVYTFRRFVENCPSRERFDDCRYVIQSDAPTLTATVEAWRQHFPRDCMLVSQLAGTAAQIVSRYSISHTQQITDRYAPVGYTDCDKQCSIVDSTGESVERGRIGRLVVTSKYLSPGEWTNEAAFGRLSPQISTLQTGDLVSLDPLGRMRHHGRCDASMEQSGYRVYFSEIEAALLEFDAVAQTVCVARELEDHRRQLVAFFVPADAASPPSDAELRGWLRTRLPEYMVPTRFLCVLELPGTTNGKISRCAVENLEIVQRSRGADLHAFENDLQRRFVEIWREAIGHEDIGIDDDILDIGGDSLSALRISAAISRCIGRQVKTGTIMKLRNIRRLVECLDRVDEPVTCVSLYPGPPRRINRRPLFCIDGLYSYRPLAEALGPGFETVGVRVRAETHLLKTCAAQGRAAGQPAGMWPPLVEQLASTYIEQIRLHQRTGPYQLIGAAFGGVIAFEMARQLTAQGESVALLGLIDSRTLRSYMPVSMRGWLNLAAQWVRTNMPMSPPDSRADRVSRQRHHERSCEIALMRYRPSPWRGNAVLFVTRQHSNINGVSSSPDLGWHSLIGGQLNTFTISDSDANPLRFPAAGTIASMLRPFLDTRVWASR
jgi:acyl-coenzyme A synthetase/AMP-(fatty) acid ligase